jgi:pimeloyl-ACP methyl ester carboxylesterase
VGWLEDPPPHDLRTVASRVAALVPSCCSVADAERATRLLPDAELHVLDCGHSPPFERPAEVNDLLRGLLDRVAQRTNGS